MWGIKQFVQQRKLLLKMIFSYLIVSFILIGIFSFLVVDKVTGNLTDDIFDSVETMNNQSFNTANVLLSSTYTYFSSVYIGSEHIINGLYGERFSVLDTYRINQYLIDLKAANPLIESIYIYNFENDAVFSSETMLQTVDDFYDKDMTQIIKNTNTSKLGIFIPRHLEALKSDQKIDKNLISLVYSKYATKEIVDSTFVVNLDQQTLQNLVTKGIGNESLQSMIINEEGTVISHSNPSLINQNWGNEAHIEKVIQSKFGKGELREEIDGKSYLISYMKADSLGWSFIGMAEINSLLTKVDKLKQFIVWLTFVFIAIAALTVLFSIRLIYTPIHRLIKRVGSSLGEMRDGAQLNEYEFLTKSFQHLESKVSDLQHNISGYRPARRKELLTFVVKGGYVPHVHDKQLSELGIRFKGDVFQVCMLRLDGYEQHFGRMDLMDMSLIKYAAANIAEEIIAGQLQASVFDDQDDGIVMLLHWASESELTQQAILKMIQDVQASISSYLKISVTAAVGSIVHTIEEIPHSWNLTYHASRYRLIYGHHAFITSEDIRANEQKEHEYPSAFEKAITDSLKMGEREKLQQAIGDFFHELKGYPYDEIMFFLSQLCGSMIRIFKGMLNEEDLMYNGISALPEKIRKQETIEQMEMEFGAVCEQIMLRRDQNSSQKNVKVVLIITDLIQQEYTNPNLSVEGLAEQVGLSTNYARKIFKDQTGKSITQYVTDYRFEKAKQLLLETDHLAGTICEMIGLTSKNHFYAAFKKYTGKSPIHFRKEYQLVDKLKDIQTQEG